MKLISVRTQGQVPHESVSEVFRIVNNLVVPQLVKVLGQGVMLPDVVHVHPEKGGASGPEGHVPIKIGGKDGEILDIDSPVVCATDSAARLSWVLLHELAHFHELSLRRAHGIKVRSPVSTALWSEYFAQRVAWSQDEIPAIDPDVDASLNATSEAEPAGKHRGRTARRTRSGFGYLFAWARAHHDARRDWLDQFPEDKRPFLSVVIPGMDTEQKLDALYLAFPKWKPEDLAWVDAYWHHINRTKLRA